MLQLSPYEIKEPTTLDTSLLSPHVIILAEKSAATAELIHLVCINFLVMHPEHIVTIKSRKYM